MSTKFPTQIQLRAAFAAASTIKDFAEIQLTKNLGTGNEAKARGYLENVEKELTRIGSLIKY